MLLQKEIQKAIHNGQAQHQIWLQEKLEAEKAARKAEWANNETQADDFLKDLPSRIQKSIETGLEFLEVVTAKDVDELRRWRDPKNWKARVMEKLLELGLEPYMSFSKSKFDWRTDSYGRKCKYPHSAVFIPLPKK